MVTANVILGAILGAAALVAVRLGIGLIRRGKPLSSGMPGYGTMALLGLVVGALVALYAFPGGDFDEAMARMTPVRTPQEFEAEVLQADVPVLVDFYSPTCPPCRVLAPRLGQIAQDYEGRVKVVKVRGDQSPELLAAYDVRAYPTVFLFAGGKRVQNWMGLHPKEEFTQAIESVLDRTPGGGKAAEPAARVQPIAAATTGNSDERTPSMQERTGEITFKGNPLTLVGAGLKVGDKAPDFTAIGNDLSPVKLGDHKGKVLILSAVPSLDTPVCDAETRKFNEKAGSLKGVTVLTVSMDLPFAQKRWCAAAGVENVITVSDHRDADFGHKYGVLIKELRLLARCVFVVDRDGKIAYIQLVNEVTNEPDYDAVLAAVKKITG